MWSALFYHNGESGVGLTFPPHWVLVMQSADPKKAEEVKVLGNLFDQLRVTSWRTYQVRPDYLVEVQRDIELPFSDLTKEAQEGYTDEVCQMLNYIGFNVQREELLLKFLPIPGSKVE